MSRMVDLIRQSAVPANIMRMAARGALSLPPAETLEVLVSLVGNPVFGEQAQLTLAGWDETASLAVVSDPQAPDAVLDYFSSPVNLRPRLVPVLLENPAVPEARLLELTHAVSRELLAALAASERVRSHPEVVRCLLGHPELAASDRAQLEALLQRECPSEEPAPVDETEEPELTAYLQEHAADIAAEEGKPFRLIDATIEEQKEIAAADSKASGMSSTAAAALALAKKEPEADESKKLSPTQKIANMSVGQRVQLAYRGNRDERSILIRDGARLVSTAVLESPKLTDSEVEAFASMKNVSESVFRTIAGKRRFMRQYIVKRLLTANPRCPIDVALPLIKELLINDLKNLSVNKNVSDTTRNFASKTFQEKSRNR